MSCVRRRRAYTMPTLHVHKLQRISHHRPPIAMRTATRTTAPATLIAPTTHIASGVAPTVLLQPPLLPQRQQHGQLHVFAGMAVATTVAAVASTSMFANELLSTFTPHTHHHTRFACRRSVVKQAATPIYMRCCLWPCVTHVTIVCGVHLCMGCVQAGRPMACAIFSNRQRLIWSGDHICSIASACQLCRQPGATIKRSSQPATTTHQNPIETHQKVMPADKPQPTKTHQKVIKRSCPFFHGPPQVIKRSSKGHQQVITRSSKGHRKVIKRSCETHARCHAPGHQK